MKKVLKWTGRLLGVLLVIALALIIATNVRLNKTYQIDAEMINIPTDQAALSRGEHMYDVFCSGCHGGNLQGGLVADDPGLGIVLASNITGAAEQYSDDELVLSIRHGVDREGRYLILMPADAHINFSAEDLGAIIAYIKTIPQSGTVSETRQFRLPGRLIIGLGMLDTLFPATYIDHNLPYPEMVEVGANGRYGEYLARHCQGCHGQNLAGGIPLNPASPPAPNLRQNSLVGSWTEESFVTAMRTGMTPEGREISAEFMPWESFAKLDDDELRGLWLYLHSLEPLVAADSGK